MSCGQHRKNQADSSFQSRDQVLFLPLSCLSASKWSFCFSQGFQLPVFIAWLDLSTGWHLYLDCQGSRNNIPQPIPCTAPFEAGLALVKQSKAMQTMNMDTREYVCCFSIKHGNLPFLHTHLMSSSGKILGLPTGQTFCLHLLLAVRDRFPSESCQFFPGNAAAVAAACTGIQTLCTISPMVHLHSAHI